MPINEELEYKASKLKLEYKASKLKYLWIKPLNKGLENKAI